MGTGFPALPKIIIPKCFSLLNQLYQITPISTGILLHLSDLLNSFPLVTTPFLNFPSQQNSLKPRSTFNGTFCDALTVHICTAQQASRSHRRLQNVAGVTEELNFLLYLIYINLDLVACGLLATVKDNTSLYSLTPVSLLPFSLNSLALILPEMAVARSKGQSLGPHKAGTSCREQTKRITLLFLTLSSLGLQDAPPFLLCLLHIRAGSLSPYLLNNAEPRAHSWYFSFLSSMLPRCSPDLSWFSTLSTC